ncbi:MAG: FlgD immunoglobulin-like domain containing protein [Pseudomonadota bacterium]
MAVSSTGNSSLDQITNSYQSTSQGKTEKDDALGQDAFLTMLVAQLQNQDPLNPMDGTDFSSQLAQFSQLEQLINLNDSMANMASAFSQDSEKDALSYIGKQVTGKVDIMNVDKGSVSGGFYNLSDPSDVMITVTDADGKTIKTLYDGQQGAGAHLVSWDGTDNAGNAVGDGTYHYSVMANSGRGYFEVPASVSGTVEGITYNNEKPYLVVQGILLDPKSLTSVIDPEKTTGTGSVDSALSYLGKIVSSNSPIVLVENDVVSGSELTFNLSSPESATIKIYDAYDELVKTIALTADDTTGGQNSIDWDGLSNSGYKVPDGMYYYTVKTDSGFAKTPVSEEVSGIKYMNGSQYLVLDESGRLVSLSSITGIN